MIRDRIDHSQLRLVRRRGRLGLVNSTAQVQAGAGGSAAKYQFDSDGLSNDPRLAFNLQSLTYGQLQNALDGADPTPDLIQSINDSINGVGLPCGTAASGDPNCDGGASGNSSVPAWVWAASAVLAGVLVLGVVKR